MSCCPNNPSVTLPVPECCWSLNPPLPFPAGQNASTPCTWDHWTAVTRRCGLHMASTACMVKRLRSPNLVELCQPVAGVASRQHLRSGTCQWQLVVIPRHRLSFYGRQAFCVAGSSVWNSLPDSLRNPVISANSFRQSLKTFLFAMYWRIQRIRGFTTMRYKIDFLLAYLLTPKSPNLYNVY